ncbi:PhoPQ-activated protein PqaA family protein [Pseudothermotoga sp. U03pept]|uniref:PhoPQ-activated protein PqaA family protein n=1 Tax=Pseudothermotoga sp. U03pept TaxID=3447012 RepID=UPI003F11226E
MKKTFVLFIVLAIVFVSAQEITNYVANYKDIEYRIISEKVTDEGFKLIHVILRSQIWQEIPWIHDLLIVQPKEISFQDAAVLFITGDFDPTRSKDVEDYLWIAEKFGVLFIVLGDVPNQPIYGLKEDDLIAHTFVEYTKTSDPRLPLLFPMTTSAVAAMDVVEEIFGSKKFLVTGPSKRGWTTWLTAVVDKRVFAIAPIVFDNLNFPKQLEQQLKMYEKYSESIGPYVRRGLPEMVNSEAGQRLLKMVDPYTYREELTMPKYIVNATNDEYWTIYSSNHYFYDLPGQNYLLYVPNNQHGIKNIPYVVDNASNFFKLSLSGKLPKFEFSTEGSRIVIPQNPQIKEVYVHRAVSDTTDFRGSLWIKLPVFADQGSYSVDIDPPQSRHIAYYVECVFEVEGLTISFCTPAVYK